MGSRFEFHFSHYWLRITAFFLSFLMLCLYLSPNHGEFGDTVKLMIAFVVAVALAHVSEVVTSLVVARREHPLAFPAPFDVNMSVEKTIKVLMPILEAADADGQPYIQKVSDGANICIRMPLRREMWSSDIGHNLDVFVRLVSEQPGVTTIVLAFLHSGNWHWLDEDSDVQVRRVREGAYSPMVNHEVRPKRQAMEEKLRSALRKGEKEYKREKRDQAATLKPVSVELPEMGEELNQEQVDYCLELAKNGDADALFRLGVLYDQGGQLDTDYERAGQFFTLAANQGHPQSQYRLALMYLAGGGLVPDEKLFVQLCSEAARQGIIGAQFRLGRHYYEKQGLERDLRQAEQWWLQAARLRYSEAQVAVACMYLNGEASPKDGQGALYWFMEAAQQGHPTAMYNLGRMYEAGQGVDQDSVESQRWYRLAAERGNADARARVSMFS